MSHIHAVLYVSLAFFGVALPRSAAAHPHVFVVVQSEILFNAHGLVSGVRHSWTFDDMYSAFVTTGLSSDGKPATSDQLKTIAQENIDDLAESGFFTSLKAPGQKIEFGKPEDASMAEDDRKLVTLRFTIPLKKPVSAGTALTLQVYDPTYFIAFDLAADGVKLVAAPAGCSLSVTPPTTLDGADQQTMTESFFSGLSPGGDFGLKLAGRSVVACP